MLHLELKRKGNSPYVLALKFSTVFPCSRRWMLLGTSLSWVHPEAQRFHL